MKLARNDLIISASEDDENISRVDDPLSGETFELGEPELFLLEQLKSSYLEVVVLTKYHAKFGKRLTSQEFQDFLQQLDEWGLLQDGSEPSVGVKHRESQKEPVEEASEIETEAPPIEESAPPVVERKDDTKQYNHLRLGCPEKYLDTFLRIVFPFRFMLYLLPAFVLFALLGFIFRFEWVASDLAKANLHFGFIGHIIFSMFTINLVAQIFRGMIARYHKVPVPSFGLILLFGMIPRFDIVIDISQDLSKKAKLWILSGSMLSRLFLLSVGVTLWLVMRSSGTLLSTVGAMLALISLISLFIVANPFLKSDGYRFLTLYFNSPKLREKADLAFRGMFSKQPEVVSRYIENKMALRVYATASILFIVCVVGFIGLTLAQWLELNYRGLGVATFLLMVTLLVLSMRKRTKFRESMMQAKKNEMNSDGEREPMKEKSSTQGGWGSPKNWNKQFIEHFKDEHGKPKAFYIFLLIFAVCMFLPYKYESGGASEVFPVAQHQIFAETSGIVEEVFYNGGEWVEKGKIIAQISNYKQLKDTKTTRSTVERKEHDINVLLTTPSKEELALAEQQLEIARLALKFSTESYQRAKDLYASKSISLVTFEEAQELMELDRQKVVEKEANLLYVKNKVNPHTIEAEKADMRRLKEELDYNEELLDRTSLKMPIDGRIVTSNLRNLQNKYLEMADLFAEVEDDSFVRIEISVPEADIGEVAVGNKVHFKAWAYHDYSIYGTVASIDPVTTETDFGKVVKVSSILPNKDGRLKGGMTGHAKIEGSDMFVITAFSRALANFIMIEIWSWLP